MMTIDQTCKDCGKSFSITEKEHEFYKRMNFDMPKRCADCRRKRKEQREGNNA